MSTLLTAIILTAPLLPPQEPPVRQESLQLRPGLTEVLEEPVVLPMKKRGQQPGVEVWVNGEGPFFFAIDSGGQGSARVDSTLLDKLKLEKVGEAQGGDPSGRQTVKMPIVKVESITVGDAAFESVHALSRSYNRPGTGLPHIDGILGYHLFDQHVLTLDYANEEVRIERGPLKAPKGAKLLELTNDPDSVPSVTAKLAGKAIEKLMIDTGKMGGIMMPPAVVETLTLLGEPQVVGRGRTITGEIEIKRAQVKGSFELGHLRLEDPPIEFSDIMKAAVLGSGTLQDQVITFDPTRKKVWIRTPAQEAAPRAAEGKKGAGTGG